MNQYYMVQMFSPEVRAQLAANRTIKQHRIVFDPIEFSMIINCIIRENCLQNWQILEIMGSLGVRLSRVSLENWIAVSPKYTPMSFHCYVLLSVINFEQYAVRNLNNLQVKKLHSLYDYLRRMYGPPEAA